MQKIYGLKGLTGKGGREAHLKPQKRESKIAQISFHCVQLLNFWQRVWYWSQNTDTEILILKYWYWNTDAEILMLKYWCWNTDTKILILKYWYWNTDTEILILKYWFWITDAEILILILKYLYWSTATEISKMSNLMPTISRPRGGNVQIISVTGPGGEVGWMMMRIFF